MGGAHLDQVVHHNVCRCVHWKCSQESVEEFQSHITDPYQSVQQILQIP